MFIHGLGVDFLYLFFKQFHLKTTGLAWTTLVTEKEISSTTLKLVVHLQLTFLLIGWQAIQTIALAAPVSYYVVILELITEWETSTVAMKPSQFACKRVLFKLNEQCYPLLLPIYVNILTLKWSIFGTIFTYIYPRGRPTVSPGSDDKFHLLSVRTFVPTFQNPCYCHIAKYWKSSEMTSYSRLISAATAESP